MQSRAQRKTRFVCISDTHNASPATGAFKLPKGDVLIHAGDLTKQGTYTELRKTLDWIENADFEVKIVVAGNHDITLDRDFYGRGSSGSSVDTCIHMFETSKVIYLDHEAETVRLEKEGGPKTTFKVFGSPYSPGKGIWAFGYQPEGAQALWDPVPLDADVVITHTPPKNHCDKNGKGDSVGCDALGQRLRLVRPRLAICGHIHESRGAERVMWDTSSSDLEQQRHVTGRWIDPVPDGQKQCRIDLTASRTVQNNEEANDQPWVWAQSDIEGSPHVNSGILGNEADQFVSSDGAPLFDSEVPDDEQLQSNTHDDGIVSGYDRARTEETCIINAAIMASSWPYKGTGHGRYNKPIVVDLNLPTWET